MYRRLSYVGDHRCVLVGIAENHVGESPDSMSADSAATKAAGSNALMHVTCAPAATEARSDAARPPIWKSGIALRATSAGVSESEAASNPAF